MKAFQLTRHGGPDVLRFRADLPTPEPGREEVRLRVTAAGLNNTDIWSREGAYGTLDDPGARAGWRRVPLDFPRIQGGDMVGEIDAVGAGVDAGRVGERVVINPVLYGEHAASGGLLDHRLIGSEIDGGFAEFAVVPAANAVAVDAALTDVELAALPIAYLTAEHMLARTGLAAGEVLLVTGASGGVGSALVQLGRARDAEVVAIAGEAKRDPVAALGAGAVVGRERFARDGAAALPGGHASIDVVADVVGGAAMAALINSLRYGGRYVTAGAIAGPLVTFDLRTMYLQHLTLLGSTTGTREDFARVVGLAAAGTIRPTVAATYPLAKLPEAQAHFLRKDFVGNIVVVP